METKGIAIAIIVIIAVIIVAAYALTMQHKPASGTTISTTVAQNTGGNTSTVTPSTAFLAGCTPGNGFSCTNSSITTYGQLSVSLVENVNTTLYNVHVACISAGSSTERPVNGSSWYALSSLGTTKPSNFSGTTIYSGAQENIANLQCYTASGNTLSTNGSQNFGGLLLLNYTATSGIVNSSNPWITSVAATLNLTAK
ncbi:MAG: hypothetical protein KGH94_00505 [Candidatus Micrarchaeota archaeon]|nr:hypothetical protein [Candidatus Micrarchaeota archaeon]